MSDDISKNPNEIQKDIETFVKQKFGGSVHIIGPQVNHSKKEEIKKPIKIEFDYKPKDLKAYLDRFVIKQDQAKKTLSIAVCDHFNHIKRCIQNPELNQKNFAKQNVLLMGPTGVGKTYLVKQISKLIGVPFIKADATRFTETGYVGANVDDLIKDLVTASDGNLELAQYGIIYLDEADKLASHSHQGGRDISGRGVQIGLLKLMEETEINLTGAFDMASQIKALMEFQSKGKVEPQIINTKHILFIVSGAFNGMPEIIAQRLNRKTIGITGDFNLDATELFPYANTQDFVEFGFEPEFIGRLPVRVDCQQLEVNDLFQILKESEESIVKQYELSFQSYGMDCMFTDDALMEIARLASKEKTGARALMTVCEKALRDFKFELPSSDVLEFIITKEVIQNPEMELKKLLTDKVFSQKLINKQKVKRFERKFFDKYKIEIEFDEEATIELEDISLKTSRSVDDICESVMQSYEHGLSLIKKSKGIQKFMLSKDVVKDPQNTLEKWVRESF